MLFSLPLRTHMAEKGLLQSHDPMLSLIKPNTINVRANIFLTYDQLQNYKNLKVMTEMKQVVIEIATLPFHYSLDRKSVV